MVVDYLEDSSPACLEHVDLKSADFEVNVINITVIISGCTERVGPRRRRCADLIVCIMM